MKHMEMMKIIKNIIIDENKRYKIITNNNGIPYFDSDNKKYTNHDNKINIRDISENDN